MTTYIVVDDDGYVEAERDGEVLWEGEVDEVAVRQLVNRPVDEAFARYVREYCSEAVLKSGRDD